MRDDFAWSAHDWIAQLALEAGSASGDREKALLNVPKPAHAPCGRVEPPIAPRPSHLETVSQKADREAQAIAMQGVLTFLIDHTVTLSGDAAMGSVKRLVVTLYSAGADKAFAVGVLSSSEETQAQLGRYDDANVMPGSIGTS